MATDDTIVKLLELYQKCKTKGEQASIFMETMNGKDTTITFRVKTPAGPQPDGRESCPRRRWKTPSQLKRDKARKDKFLAKKLEEQNAAEASEEIMLVEPKDEVVPEVCVQVCEKIFIFPQQGLKVKKVKVERIGNPVKGEYVRTEVWIEPADAKMIENEDYEIENCWVLPFI